MGDTEFEVQYRYQVLWNEWIYRVQYRILLYCTCMSSHRYTTKPEWKGIQNSEKTPQNESGYVDMSRVDDRSDYLEKGG